MPDKQDFERPGHAQDVFEILVQWWGWRRGQNTVRLGEGGRAIPAGGAGASINMSPDKVSVLTKLAAAVWEAL